MVLRVLLLGLLACQVFAVELARNEKIEKRTKLRRNMVSAIKYGNLDRVGDIAAQILSKSLDTDLGEADFRRMGQSVDVMPPLSTFLIWKLQRISEDQLTHLLEDWQTEEILLFFGGSTRFNLNEDLEPKIIPEKSWIRIRFHQNSVDVDLIRSLGRKRPTVSLQIREWYPDVFKSRSQALRLGLVIAQAQANYWYSLYDSLHTNKLPFFEYVFPDKGSPLLADLRDQIAEEVLLSLRYKPEFLDKKFVTRGGFMEAVYEHAIENRHQDFPRPFLEGAWKKTEEKSDNDEETTDYSGYRFLSDSQFLFEQGYQFQFSPTSIGVVREDGVEIFKKEAPINGPDLFRVARTAVRVICADLVKP
ncbi:MAG: hypothetical protein AB7F43_01335 [Bacteriovoracia bacterium]